MTFVPLLILLISVSPSIGFGMFGPSLFFGGMMGPAFGFQQPFFPSSFRGPGYYPYSPFGYRPEVFNSFNPGFGFNSFPPPPPPNSFYFNPYGGGGRPFGHFGQPPPFPPQYSPAATFPGAQGGPQGPGFWPYGNYGPTRGNNPQIPYQQPQQQPAKYQTLPPQQLPEQQQYNGPFQQQQRPNGFNSQPNPVASVAGPPPLSNDQSNQQQQQQQSVYPPQQQQQQQLEVPAPSYNNPAGAGSSDLSRVFTPPPPLQQQYQTTPSPIQQQSGINEYSTTIAPYAFVTEPIPTPADPQQQGGQGGFAQPPTADQAAQNVPYVKHQMPYYSQDQLDQHFNGMQNPAENKNNAAFENDNDQMRWYLDKAKAVLQSHHNPNPNTVPTS